MYQNNILRDIENIEDIYIAAHINPDGDAIGSTFSFAQSIKKLGKNPIILLDSYDKKFNILMGKEFIFDGDYDNINPDIFFSLDCGAKDRLGRAEAVFDRAKITYNIDHHISNNNFANNNIVNPKASSASEVVYEIVKDMVDIDKNIATAIYTGILTDTGGFMHNCTSERTHQIAGRLVCCGVDTPFVHSKILMEHTISQVKVFNKALDNLIVDDKLAYIALSDNDIKSCGATSSDLEGIVSYILNIEGIEVSMFATERENNVVKLSLRSKKVDVNSVASVFGGGGHILAAGASIKDKSLEKSVELAVKELKSRLN